VVVVLNGRFRRFGPLATGLMLGLSAIFVLHACAQERGVNAATADSPQAAIAHLVEARGERYAGLCETTRSPDDIGKVCSRLIEDRGAIEAHLIGRTFSEFSTWVFLSERDSGWSVVATEPLDFLDSTGTVPWPR
jgi:hypothetical protein